MKRNWVLHCMNRWKLVVEPWQEFNKRWYGATAGSMKVHKLELRGTIEVSQSLRCSESAGYNFPSARHVVSSCDGGTSF